MCLICVELAKSKMTAREGREALREMRVAMDKAHVAEVEAKLASAEQDEKKP
jgi:hypothetical protein